jgi:hypothetical protein
MSIVKSFSVGEGDMFYIKHGSSNFTIIDSLYILTCQSHPFRKVRATSLVK